MPLFRRSEPDARALIAYLVARSREKNITLNQTKLVKLLYLVDVERVASGRGQLTGLEWVFYDYGPYAFELPRILKQMEGTDLVVSQWQGATLYRAAPGAPEGEDWPPATQMLVDNIIRRFGAMDLNELLDHVYFHTAPMEGAVRGEPLHMSRARTNAALRPQPPLAPPRLSEGAHERMASAMRRRRETHMPLSDEERRPFFSDATEEFDVPALGGKLVVPEDTEL